MKKSFFVFWWALGAFTAVSLLAADPVLALPSVNHLASDYLVEKGKAFYQAGDKTNAIHELSKAILADPQNKEAREYLAKMGIQDGVYGSPSRQLDVMIKLTEDLDQTQERLQALDLEKKRQEEVNRSLEKITRALEEEVDRKTAQLDELSAQFEQEKAKQQTEGPQGTVTAQKSREIARLNTDLYLLKDRLARNLEEVKANQEQAKTLDTQIRQLEQQLQLTHHDWRKSNLEYEQRMQQLEHEFNQYKDAATADDIKKREQIRQMRDDLRKRMEQVSRLSNQVVVKEYQRAHLDGLNASKDSAIADLQKNVRGGGEGETPTASELERIAFIKRQDRQISELKERLLEAQRQLESGPGAFAASGDLAKVDELRAQIQGMEEQLRDKTGTLEGQNLEMEQLRRRFEETQERLEQLEGQMSEKDSELSDLEKQLDGVLQDME